MHKLTYRQAYDKIIEAYFKDEIKPLDPHFCFCGTLNEGFGTYWATWERKFDGVFYNGIELQKMETALISTLSNELEIDIRLGEVSQAIIMKMKGYEQALFIAMSSALDVLKEIHRSRGENVDEEIPAFTKRELKQLIQ